MKLRSFYNDAKRNGAKVIAKPKVRILRSRAIERIALTNRNQIINRRASEQIQSNINPRGNRISLPIAGKQTTIRKN